MALQLHEAKKHDHVIALLEAALTEGKSQPWMYPVLALSMEIAGRPQEEIERVVLSVPDFTGADVPSMLYSAAYLTNYGRDDAALQLYRQASRLEPTRPEAYVMALPLARKTKNAELIQWSAAGILTHAWTHDHPQLHREAEDALRQCYVDLMKTDQQELAHAVLKTHREALLRDLTVLVEWSGLGDVDLSVEEPPQTFCSRNNPQSPGGGVLVHDGMGFTDDDRFDRYVCAFGMPGMYQIKIRHVSGEIVGKRVKLTVIRYQGSPKESKDVRVVPLDGNKTEIVRVELAEGRRTRLRAIPAPDSMTGGPQRRRYQTLEEKVGPLTREQKLAGKKFEENQQQNNIPVGFQPVISTLSEGVTLSAMAVISGDRRYVRLTTVPTFSNITDVFTFSFFQSGNNGGNNQGNGN